MSNIRIEGLSKSYGATRCWMVLISRWRRENAFFASPSGCGKTFLMRLLAGFETPDAGRIVIDDTVVADANVYVLTDRRGIGMVFQDYAVWPYMSVHENVAYPLKLAGLSADERATRTSSNRSGRSSWA